MSEYEDPSKQEGYDLPREEVKHNLPIIAAISLAAKKDLSKLSPAGTLAAYEKEIDNLQLAAMKRYPK